MQRIITRLSAAQASVGMVNGICTPFLAVWLAWRGLSASQIALALSLGLLLRTLAGPAAGIIADARNDRRIVMLMLYWALFLSYLAMCFATAPWAVITTAVVANVATGVALPLLESVSVRLADHYGYHYGSVRLWASTSFVLSNVIGGVCLWWFGAIAIAPLLALTASCIVLTVGRLPAPPNKQSRNAFRLGFKRTWTETGELLRSPVFILFLTAASLTQSSHAFYYGYGGLHWRQLGYPGWLIGVIWPLGVFAEIALLRFSHRLVNWVRPEWLLFWGGVICAFRWAVLSFDPPLPLVIFAQCLHGFTFGFSHLGAMFFILKAVPYRLAATAQSVYFMVFSGLVMGAATYGAGSLYGELGGHAYLIMTAMALSGMLFAVILSRVWKGNHILHSESAEIVDRI